MEGFVVVLVFIFPQLISLLVHFKFWLHSTVPPPSGLWSF